MVLDRVRRARFLARAALDALVYVWAGGLVIDYLVHAGWTDRHALAYPGALVIVNFDDDAELLALPLAHVDHERHLAAA